MLIYLTINICSLLLHAPKKQQLMLIYRYLTITCNCWFYIIINYTTPLANTLHHCLHIILCLSPSETTPLANKLHHCLHIILCLSPSCVLGTFVLIVQNSSQSEPLEMTHHPTPAFYVLHHRTTNGNWPFLSHISEPGVHARCTSLWCRFLSIAI